MQDNARLTKLILGQVPGRANDSAAEIDLLLGQALQSSKSRLDLRDRLFAGTRETNEFTENDVVEVLSETLSDQIRDLDAAADLAEHGALPSRFIMSTAIAGMLGAVTALVYGVADITTAIAAFCVGGLAFFATQTYRKRVLRLISNLKKQRADYEGFRKLLHRSL